MAGRHCAIRSGPTCVDAEVLEGELEVGDVWPPLLMPKHLHVAEFELFKACHSVTQPSSTNK